MQPVLYTNNSHIIESLHLILIFSQILFTSQTPKKLSYFTYK